jgi:pseudouridine kinase
MSRVAVIGAVNIDICGRPFNPLIMRDSNPGTVTMSMGGVGRNIAHNLRLLGLDVTFITALGGDLYAKSVEESCLELGFDMSLARRVPGRRTSSYLYITDSAGDMELGLSDTDVADTLNPEYLEKCLASINLADAVVIDGNLTDESIAYIAENCTAPLYADPVSVTKAERLRPILSRLAAFKPNEIEAMHLTGAQNAADAARALVDIGVSRAYVSMGANGIVAAEKYGMVRLPCSPSVLVNATGAGDAAVAAIVWAGINGLSLEASARAAMKAGAIAIASPLTNSPELSAEKLI